MSFFTNIQKKMMRASIVTKQLSLVWHLQSGGKITDPDASKHLVELVQLAFKDADFSEVARTHNFSVEDICVFYAAMVIELDPEPVVVHGGSKLVVPSFCLLEPNLLDTAFSIIDRETAGLPSLERRKGVNSPPY
jgi:hypothetical protein